ncbi:MAG: methionyl-tRNA formyltransferase [Erysipelotrichaceae bacterium]|nr:methionyl-tRNA formyltransferase [Erysipelotrichaceae bacterium]
MNEKIVFMGTPEFAANVLEGLLQANYNVVGVVTQADKKVGRKQILTPSPVKEVGLKYNLPVFTPIRIKEDYQNILDLEPDLIITCAYGQFIPLELIEYPKYKSINTHGSLLPKYRGGAPIQWSIINGEEETGISIIYMSKAMDAGDVLKTRTIKIEREDTNATMFKKLSDVARDLLLDFLPDFFKGNFERVPQVESEATFAYNLSKADEYINFNRDVKAVYNHIRGLLDNPGAYSVINDKKLKFMKVDYEEKTDTDPKVFKGLENNYLRIDCQNGFIKVFEIKPEGKNTMDAKSFFNGVGKSLVNLEFKETYE